MPNSETIPMKDFTDGLGTTVGELTQGRPGLRIFLDGFGLSSETPISLGTSLTLFVASPDFHYMGASDATMGGKPIQIGEENIGSFDLSE
jgi:hypothetical protein